MMFRKRRRIRQLEADVARLKQKNADLRWKFAEYRLDHGAGPEDIEANRVAAVRYARKVYGKPREQGQDYADEAQFWCGA